ncbi:MAG: hypothetical protein U9R54_02905 [Bacteroidota bacterium]|nr:hypothetical protein [Bacteroidota bacterium]
MNEESNLNPKKSLEIINEMISNTRASFNDASFYFLLWGWIIFAGGLGHYILLEFTNYEHPYISWSVVIIGIIISIVKGVIEGKRSTTKSHLERIYIYIWFAFLASYFVIIVFMENVNYQITPLIFLLAANATFLSGIVLKYKPLIYGSIFIFISTIVMFNLSYDMQLLGIPITMLIGYLIPGYLLKYKANK